MQKILSFWYVTTLTFGISHRIISDLGKSNWLCLNYAEQRYWNHTLAWVFSCKFSACFQNTFSLEDLWRAVSVFKLILFLVFLIFLMRAIKLLSNNIEMAFYDVISGNLITFPNPCVSLLYKILIFMQKQEKWTGVLISSMQKEQQGVKDISNL